MILKKGDKLKAKIDILGAVVADKIYEVLGFDADGDPIVMWEDGTVTGASTYWFSIVDTSSLYCIMRKFNVGTPEEHIQPHGCIYTSKEEAEASLMPDRGDIGVYELIPVKN